MNIISKEFKYDGINYIFYGFEGEHIFKSIPWYEKKLLEEIKRRNIKGAYIDVGANIGNHSIFFLNHCNSEKSYSFEADKECFDLLQKNIKFNTKKPHIISNIAIWDEPGNLSFNKSKDERNRGMGYVSESGDQNIKSDKLDNLIPESENITLIKIDVEGAETKVLNGAIKIIIKYNPIIICEAAQIKEVSEINNILIPLGYKTVLPNIKKYNATPTYIWEPREAKN